MLKPSENSFGSGSKPIGNLRKIATFFTAFLGCRKNDRGA